MTMPLPSNKPPPRYSEGELRQFRAGAHAADARRYEWLACQLRMLRKADIAEKADRWAKEHERLAFELLRLPGRDHV